MEGQIFGGIEGGIGGIYLEVLMEERKNTPKSGNTILPAGNVFLEGQLSIIGGSGGLRNWSLGNAFPLDQIWKKIYV